jgi:hypothetical protein
VLEEPHTFWAAVSWIHYYTEKKKKERGEEGAVKADGGRGRIGLRGRTVSKISL